MTPVHGLLDPVPAATSPDPAPRPDPGDLSYEQAREELVAVVARLEAGGETLEGSLALWERGEALAERCQEWLDGARRRLDSARTSPGDPATTAAVDPGSPTDDDEDVR